MVPGHVALNPGQRIDLKKRVAETLSRQSPADIDLVLSEFGFATDDEWRGESHPYVLAMLGLGNPDDVSLEQLDSYLHPSAVEAAPPQPEVFDDPTSPWEGTGLRLFLSHVSAYAEHAGALREELGKRSIDAFVAHDSIAPTQEWKDVILSALRSCDACVALLTPGFPESNWTDQEVGFVMARSRLVIPLDYGVTPYGFLGEFQALSVKRGQNQADISLAIFELLVRSPRSREAMAKALVNRWADTQSWDDARENYGFLRMIPREAWSAQMIADVWKARDTAYFLKTASIDWQDSDVALNDLFEDLPSAQRNLAQQEEGSAPLDPDDDIPF